MNRRITPADLNGAHWRDRPFNDMSREELLEVICNYHNVLLDARSDLAEARDMVLRRSLAVTDGTAPAKRRAWWPMW